MGSIAVREGMLYFDFRYRKTRCREYTRLPDNATNRKRMEKVLARIEGDIVEGVFDYARYFPDSRRARDFDTPSRGGSPLQVASRHADTEPAPLFSELVEKWKHQKQVEWRDSYRTAVDSILDRHLLPAFGDQTVDQIDRDAVLAFRADLVNAERVTCGGNGKSERKLKPATVNRVIGILRMIMEEASLITGAPNPCASVKRLKVRKTDIQPFTVEEMRQILDAAREDYRPYLTLRFLTGLRSGEVHGLKWRHVDFDRRQLLVRETYSHGRTEYTKTDGSQREIDLAQPVIEALEQMKPEGFDANPRQFADQYVFATRAGGPVNNQNFVNRVWKPLLRHLDIEDRRPYQMRHTCATLWLAAGEAPEWIARQLGHTTTEMLFRVYSRYVPNLTRRDGSAFDSFVSAAMHGGVEEAEDA
nr:site-specific integrase [Oceanococcus sp. HetDA_MAG_MS8]